MSGRWNNDGVSIVSSRVTSIGVDAEQAALDQWYVAKLHRKLKQGFMVRGVNGIPQLGQAWKEVDVEREKRCDVWEFKGVMKGSGVKLSDKELDVLFVVYDYDSRGELDMDEFLAELREKFSCTHQQVDDILRKIRSKIPDGNPMALFPSLDPSQDVPLTQMAFNRCLKRSRVALNLTPSDLILLFRYFQDNGRVSLHLLLDNFEKPTKEQTLQMILLKLRDATEDRDRTHSGCIGLSRMLTRSGGGKLTRDGFKMGMKNFGCGLRDGEIDLLFDSVAEHGTVKVKHLMDILQEDPYPATPEEVEFLTEKLNRELTSRHINGVAHFRMKTEDLAEEDGQITLYNLASAIRDMLSASHFPDFEIEILFNAHKTVAGAVTIPIDPFIASVRGYFSPTREEIIEQTWKKLDVDDLHEIPVEAFFAAFKPELLPEVQSNRRSAGDVLNEVKMYLETDKYDVISRDAFFSYWADVSASVDTDKVFTLVMWNSFEINKMRKTNAQGDRNHAPVTASPTKASPAAQMKHRSVERAQQRRINPTTSPNRFTREKDIDVEVVDPGNHVEHARQPDERPAPRRPSPNPPGGDDMGFDLGATVPQRNGVVTPPEEKINPPQAQANHTPPQSSQSSVPHGVSPNRGRRFVAGQGFGGGRSTLNLFGGPSDEAPASTRRHADPNARSQGTQQRQQKVGFFDNPGKGSITGCGMRGTTAQGRRQLHTERPF